MPACLLAGWEREEESPRDTGMAEMEMGRGGAGSMGRDGGGDLAK